MRPPGHIITPLTIKTNIRKKDNIKTYVIILKGYLKGHHQVRTLNQNLNENKNLSSEGKILLSPKI